MAQPNPVNQLRQRLQTVEEQLTQVLQEIQVLKSGNTVRTEQEKTIIVLEDRLKSKCEQMEKLEAELKMEREKRVQLEMEVRALRERVVITNQATGSEGNTDQPTGVERNENADQPTGVERNENANQPAGVERNDENGNQPARSKMDELVSALNNVCDQLSFANIIKMHTNNSKTEIENIFKSSLETRNSSALKTLCHLEHTNEINQNKVLVYAAISGNAELLKFLIEKNLDWKFLRWVPESELLHKAADYGQSEICKMLLTAMKGSVKTKDDLGNTPLFYAARRRHLDVCRVLLNAGAEVNISNQRGDTPLYDAVATGSLPVVQLLVDCGADVNSSNRDDKTPLHAAAGLGFLSVAEFLIQKGANVSARDIYCCTPLHAAATGGSLPLVELLIEKGADVNSVTTLNNTPLHKAAMSGDLSIVKFLVEKGADMYVRNNNSKRAIDIAADADVRYFLINE